MELRQKRGTLTLGSMECGLAYRTKSCLSLKPNMGQVTCVTTSLKSWICQMQWGEDTLQWRTLHTAVAHATHCSGAHYTLQWRTLHTAVAHATHCSGARYTLQWRTLHTAVAHATHCSGAHYTLHTAVAQTTGSTLFGKTHTMQAVEWSRVVKVGLCQVVVLPCSATCPTPRAPPSP